MTNRQAEPKPRTLLIKNSTQAQLDNYIAALNRDIKRAKTERIETQIHFCKARIISFFSFSILNLVFIVLSCISFFGAPWSALLVFVFIFALTFSIHACLQAIKDWRIANQKRKMKREYNDDDDKKTLEEHLQTLTTF